MPLPSPERLGRSLIPRAARAAAAAVLALMALASGGRAQQALPDPVFHTFSLVARDPGTGEVGVAVTTRNDCVGNRVPYVRAGVGAVATQAWTRYEYGPEILDLLEDGTPSGEALERVLADDTLAHRRQVGVISAAGATAQHTGRSAPDWSGDRAGSDYAIQGNILTGPGVVDSVAASFEATAGSGRPLADRLVAALEAGQQAGGDAREGRIQSAAVLVADPRPGASPRPGGVTTDIHVCAHPTPVAELRRIRDRVAGELGHRTLKLARSPDAWQLHALGYYRPAADSLPLGRASSTYTTETAAVSPEWTWREKLWVVPSETRLGTQELAEALGRKRSWIHHRTQASAEEPIPHRKQAGRLIFTAGEVRTWVREQEDVIVAVAMDPGTCSDDSPVVEPHLTP